MLHAHPLLAGYLLFWLAVLGSAAGSFAACAASRWPQKPTGRSRCDSCGHPLAARDLVPVISYLAGRGRCRWCGQKIPPSCLWAELVLAAVFAGMGLRFGPGPELALWLAAAGVLLFLSLVDLRLQLIPNGALLLLCAIRAAFWLIECQPLPALLGRVGPALLVPAGLLALTLIMDKALGRESMGGGDIKLLAALALYLGWMELLLALFAGCLMGLAAALLQKKGRAPFAFGPFLAAGCLFTVWFGGPVLAWYTGLF